MISSIHINNTIQFATYDVHILHSDTIIYVYTYIGIYIYIYIYTFIHIYIQIYTRDTYNDVT